MATLVDMAEQARLNEMERSPMQRQTEQRAYEEVKHGPTKPDKLYRPFSVPDLSQVSTGGVSGIYTTPTEPFIPDWWCVRLAYVDTAAAPSKVGVPVILTQGPGGDALTVVVPGNGEAVAVNLPGRNTYLVVDNSANSAVKVAVYGCAMIGYCPKDIL